MSVMRAIDMVIDWVAIVSGGIILYLVYQGISREKYIRHLKKKHELEILKMRAAMEAKYLDKLAEHHAKMEIKERL